MEVLTHKIIVYEQDSYDFNLVRDYLKEVEKRGRKLFYMHKGVVLKCLNAIKRGILEIDMGDVIDYLEIYIDTETIQISTKENYRNILKAFFDYVVGKVIKKHRTYTNPVPNKRVFRFEKNPKDFKKQKDKKVKRFTFEEIRELLLKTRKTDERDFQAHLIGAFSGARPSEIITIRIENINFKERYFETGFYKDAMKSNKSLLFFIPKKTIPFIQKYIILKLDDRKEGWLFPSQKDVSKHLTIQGFKGTLKNRYGQATQFKKFRSAIITYRGMNDCPPHINEILQNHAGSSIQAKHYDDKPLEVKRDDYDKFFPYYNLKLPFF